MNKRLVIGILLCLCFTGCSEDSYTYTPIEFPEGPEDPGGEPLPSDDELLDLTQRETFRYFWEFAESNSGAARERYHPGNPGFDANTVATGGTGFGLMALIVGIERNYISREQGAARISQILDFFAAADRFHGAWPHWLDGTSGRVRPFSSLDDGGDLVETAFLVQGLICIQEYFKDGNPDEKALSVQAETLWKDVEWDWFTKGEETLYWHWSPNHGFAINLALKGYNEVLIAYVLAAASPDYGIDRAVYSSGWASKGGILSGNSQYGFPLLVKHAGSETFGGPLFWAHYSYLGLDPRKLSDEYVNYWDVNRNHSRINYQYCVENPMNFAGYGPDCWGLTASYTRNPDGTIGYAAHKPGNDKGIISPTAAISSIPYTPDVSLRALRYFYRNRDFLLGPAGFYDAFSPGPGKWVAEAYLAIDQGPEIVMIENYRTGLLWELFMQNPEVLQGLQKLGFTYE
jgi:hypothetical protein